MNPNYLGAYALEEGSDTLLTIASVAEEEIKTTTGDTDRKMVIHFKEAVKPMIVNATNAKTIEKIAESAYIEDWIGVRIQIGSAVVHAFGADHEALRVRAKKVPVENPLKK
jgi:hypothetical protein